MTAAGATNDEITTLRRRAMAVLADSCLDDIAEHMSVLTVPPYQELRAPENGLVMVRGRIGGDGSPFNLGEATVTRAAVKLAGGEVGFAYVLGRDPHKAKLIAVCDAMIQSADCAHVLDAVVQPLERAMAARRQQQDAETAATRVNFFTLVRGEG
ncbi:phosphonate C-P lyase system protein PhnG [Bradyrhizobium sp. LHD-71]|uniref:phosphonate C-P lyase system protein PhnG n=1 Tax=Bradyrhizobium sp. LHD-71 TaxID=3072141 RepID=UPI00280EFFE9|nr:phosphonate C-P lyase system protein PhnG [Bradyrhizobium sp. LHD-71]MDQ8726527.1 phosphonate C-P lyase system protein PhnG [Bradyrhizobium sp. LHD-71]